MSSIDVLETELMTYFITKRLKTLKLAHFCKLIIGAITRPNLIQNYFSWDEIPTLN